MSRLLARLRDLWTQFLDNPFTMFDRSERDVDHNTMTGRTGRHDQEVSGGEGDR